MKLYMTYCSGQKDDSLKGTGIEVTPDVLYTSKRRIVPFMEMCKEMRVEWAIFSDLYGVWLHNEKHTWYAKGPDEVSGSEYQWLLNNFNSRLKNYESIYFYRPSEKMFHSLYRRLVNESELKDRIVFIQSIVQIRP